MQLILARHAEPEAAEAGPDGAPADPELSSRGRVQASALGWWAANNTSEKITEIVVSGMRRAQETAQPVADALGLTPVVETDLAEFDLGRSSYTPVHQRIDSDDPDWERIKEGFLPEFVDVGAFTARVRGAFDRILARHADAGRESVLVVCHAGTINMFLALELALARPLTFPLDHAGLSRVLVSRSGTRKVRSVNETGHVADLL
ncbi:histidine phosphatase family protein [Actinomycetospora sp. NBRC 106378]|uniref:histidine phosphatase family protein n=1 Tax=Actinomycetospora sp. NBRC 106378 TaxID=3032208 RepID=UPI0024A34713|nr:histidine phosphatase family protein [Actinomycetospora sp. NBRC 106378]GLZ53890.1 phosphoglycerate mutase [Actinomycetospora sp. NBRC 106378]